MRTALDDAWSELHDAKPEDFDHISWLTWRDSHRPDNVMPTKVPVLSPRPVLRSFPTSDARLLHASGHLKVASFAPAYRLTSGGTPPAVSTGVSIPATFWPMPHGFTRGRRSPASQVSARVSGRK